MDGSNGLSSLELAHEEDVLRRPYVLKAWLAYLQALEGSLPDRRFLIYERALATLPGSYKLWLAYLTERRAQVKGKHPDSPAFDRMDTVFERAIVYMHKMPVIWVLYCTNLVEQRRWTRARRACDGALRALPVTQHHRIWPIYLRLAREVGVGETGARVLRRFCKLDPDEGVEELFGFLESSEKYDEAAEILAEALENPEFKGKKKTRQQLWNDLAKLSVQHPKEIVSIDVNAFIRGGIRAAKEESGDLWVSLAEYYARSGIFERARDVYEEALKSVTTVRDFAVIFDSYSSFEEAMITSKLGSIDPNQPDEEKNMDLEILVCRLERLTERRPYLLSSVILRQNPHNVHEWHKRARLYIKHEDTVGAVNAYTQAVRTVDPWKAANGKSHTLWLAFAYFYENHKDLASARKVYEKAVASFDKYRSSEDLAAVWCEYAEFELRHGDYEKTESLLRRATTEPRQAKRLCVQSRGNAKVVLGAGSGGHAITHNYSKDLPALGAWKSTRLWSLFADFQESVNGVSAAMEVYESMTDLKIVTVDNVLEAARNLEENKHFENAFKIYERGMALFKWPAVLPVYLRYTKKFVDRFGGRKLERARELFEQAIRGAPAEDPRLLMVYMLYAEMEEKVGLAQRAMDVYARAAKAIPQKQRADLYRVYAAKAVEMFGVTRTRTVFEDALETLTDKSALVEFTTRFASIEISLGEIDRARSIYAHGAQFADPDGAQQFSNFWALWDEFEVAHGSEDTYREMLRIKRSVTTQYSFANVSAASKPVETPADGSAPQVSGEGTLEALEKEAQDSAQVVPETNEEEIEIDLDEDEDEDEDVEEVQKAEAPEQPSTVDETTRKRPATDMEITEKPVPAAVFGGLVKEGGENGEEDEKEPVRNAPMGALERLKRRRA
ncbi:hypothetical protein NDN08_000736 [Rhodosorus marinus]|uniref:Suppressor of forked domain-containing protein n=1 Tax=Rhodosorus marinus TaxID=101924 RepID=A0AAV8UUH8_9RHOD|nr:hypothetical protein NDN08_000736 [Rhodosorus marinus]